jgi:hypothetical protein
MNTKKQLPIGVSTLAEIIKSNLLYIDKTELVHRLITSNRRCFLSRPRRFGKSLLISTMKEIFLGNKELFKDVWIGQEGRYSWHPRPVIHLDFSEMDSQDEQTLKQSINIILDSIAVEYHCNIAHLDSPGNKLSLLVRHMAHTSPHKIAILVDEYDSPMLKHISDPDKATQIRSVLASFYTTIKALDQFIHFTFVTGVTKFSKTSLFSGANNLDDISLSWKFAALCGYTEEEITTYFHSYIKEFSDSASIEPSHIMDEMRTWYNGYRFSDLPSQKIYNPYSVLLYLNHQICKNYWFATGTPTFLIKIIKENLTTFATVDHTTTDSDMLSTFEVGSFPLKTILYQTGYLTIENFNQQSRNYALTYPNEEVRQSLNLVLMKSVLELRDESVQDTLHTLRQALQAKEMETFCKTLQILFAHIPYQLHIKEEAFYHALLQMICYLLGFDVTSEVSVANGIIDMVIQTTITTYVFEFKLNRSAKDALKQIHTRRYYEKYLLNGKGMYLIGLAFDYETKIITQVTEKVR